MKSLNIYLLAFASWNICFLRCSEEKVESKSLQRPYLYDVQFLNACNTLLLRICDLCVTIPINGICLGLMCTQSAYTVLLNLKLTIFQEIMTN
jgi:hypothetical protein